MVISFTIPGDPKGKARPRLGRSGHAYTPADTVSYENLVKLCFREAAGDDWTPIGPDVPISCRIYAYYPIPKSVSKKRRAAMLDGLLLPLRKPDWDNIGKIVCDALNRIAYDDDAQICDARVLKLYSDQPRVNVELRW